MDMPSEKSFGVCKDCGANLTLAHFKTCKPEPLPPAVSQRSVYEWAEQTFGAADALGSVRRAQEEMRELEHALRSSANPTDVVFEIADIVIPLLRLAEIVRLQAPETVPLLSSTIAVKMLINRKRTWITTGTGHGHHKKFSA